MRQASLFRRGDGHEVTAAGGGDEGWFGAVRCNWCRGFLFLLRALFVGRGHWCLLWSGCTSVGESGVPAPLQQTAPVAPTPLQAPARFACLGGGVWGSHNQCSQAPKHQKGRKMSKESEHCCNKRGTTRVTDVQPCGSPNVLLLLTNSKVSPTLSPLLYCLTPDLAFFEFTQSITSFSFSSLPQFCPQRSCHVSFLKRVGGNEQGAQ